MSAALKLPISPLVGEMSGRTEGGNVECLSFETAALSSVSLVKSRARPFLPSAATAARIASVAAQAAPSVRSPRNGVAVTRIAGHGEPPDNAAVDARRRQPDVGHDLIHSGPSAAVDHDRHLWAEPRFQPGRGDALANALGERARVGDFLRIESGQRRRLDRHAGAHRNTQRIDIARQAQCRSRRQPPDLQIAARGDFDDAVAVAAAPLRTSPIKVLGKNPEATGLSRTSSPSPVCIGAASVGQRPASQRRVHAAISWARASAISAARSPSTELRSGCQRPRRRAAARRSAMARAAAGFSRRMKSRTFAVAEIGVVHRLDQRAGNRRRWSRQSRPAGRRSRRIRRRRAARAASGLR